MSKFTKFQSVAVADNIDDVFESANYLGLTGEDYGEEYPHEVLIGCEGIFSVENYKLCAPIDEKGQPILHKIKRDCLLNQQQGLKEKEECLIADVKRAQSTLSRLLSTLEGVEEKLEELDSNN